MTIEEIKDIVKDIPEGSKGLAMGHPINETLIIIFNNYY